MLEDILEVVFCPGQNYFPLAWFMSNFGSHFLGSMEMEKEDSQREE